MSDESEKEYNQGYEDGYHNAAMTRVHAVDRLESQNQALQEALRGLLHALGAHTVTLGAVIDHMTQHECFCQQADALYRADAESGDALHVAVNHAQAALSPTQETDPG